MPLVSLFYSLIAYFIFVISIVLISPVTPWYTYFTFGLITHLGEELGWRGWLQDHLKIESPIKKSLAIGVIWALIIHMAINISFEGTTQLIAVTACLPFWAWLIWNWPKASITEEKRL